MKKRRPVITREHSKPLGHDPVNRLATVDLQAFPAGDVQAMRVEAQEIHDGGVDIGDVVAGLDGVEAEFVGVAVDDSLLDPGAREEDAETVRVMVATVGAARSLSTAGVRPNSVPKDDNRVISSPRRLRSFNSPATGLSILLQASAWFDFSR